MLIRHAEAAHNRCFAAAKAAAAAEGAAVPEVSQRHNELKAAGYNALDPLLTAEGEGAARELGGELGEGLRHCAGGDNWLLVTSPLRRAMQTAIYLSIYLYR